MNVNVTHLRQTNQPFPGEARPALAAVPPPGRGVPLAGDLVAAALALPARPEGSPGPVRLVPEVSHGALLATPPGVSPRAQAVLDGAGSREPGRLRHRDVEHHLSEKSNDATRTSTDIRVQNFSFYRDPLKGGP